MELDHLVVAVPDLAAAAKDWDSRGFTSVEGGVHAEWGTANRLIVLRGAYVELIAVVDAAVAAESRFGSWVAAAAADGPHLIGAVMRDANFDGVCRRLSLEPMAAQRRLPGGEIVRWRLAGVESMIDRGLPAFIDWTDADPRFTSGTGSVEVLELGGGPLTQTWLGTDVAGVRVVDGPAGPRRAVVRRSQAIAELAG